MAPAVQDFADSTRGEAPVRGFLHSADKTSGFIVLTHGAGGNCNSPLLVGLAELFAAHGLTALRCDLPYRQRRATGPPGSADARLDQEGLRRAVSLLRGRVGGRAYLGGVSYGGRQASLLAAAEPSLLNGLLLLSYPLHPPGRPSQLRTAHFPSLRTPALFISGTRDAFGSIEELTAALKLIPAQTELAAVEGASHGLLHKSNQAQLPAMVVERFSKFLLE